MTDGRKENKKRLEEGKETLLLHTNIALNNSQSVPGFERLLGAFHICSRHAPSIF